LIRAGSDDHGIDGHDHSAGLYHCEFDLVVGGFPDTGLATTKATNIPTARESFDAFMTDFQNAESTYWPLNRKKSPTMSRPNSAAGPRNLRQSVLRSIRDRPIFTCDGRYQPLPPSPPVDEA
jgi:hypothetical protein